MIIGIGCDITKNSRFEKWIENNYIERFFNEKEISNKKNPESLTERQKSHLTQHYGARFCAKEAFAKALGTGFTDFELKEIWIENDEYGKPILKVEGKALKLLEKTAGTVIDNINLNVSLSHENEYSMAVVLIERN